ncbi:DNA cytosine methyltransferase [Heyndrickxia camelliae]|uniref:DNA cytosine methyltransferase n=1 Tax=Heyndrickxia camelliae TaxID=1707093 RepID=UPI001F481B1A|nr:DNA cytosine methyltransferase [Heyndrickxia camelliae]
MKLIKSRIAKKSNRGLYLQDKELRNTVFKPGTNFKYVVDIQNRKIIILPSDSKGNTVSKRKIKDSIKPVIDIRSKDILSLLKNSSYLQVSIYGEHIVVGVFENDNNTACEHVQKLQGTIKKKIGQIFKIQDFRKTKPKVTFQFSKTELENVVGQTTSFQQLNIFDFLPNQETKTAHVYDLHNALSEISIPLKVVSLFSGAGLLDFAFMQSGFDVIFALEKDAEIAKTYRHNIGDIEVADIKTFDKSKLPYAPIVIGGSPCKGFSNSNRYTNFLDNPNNLLVKEYIKSVKQIKPYVFVLENVPQILTAGEGQFIKEIEQELSNYQITKGVVSSADYGDPQDRKRAFIIGSRLGAPISLPNAILPKNLFQTVRNAFKGLNSSVPNQNDVSKPKSITLERIMHVKPGGNVFDIPESIRPKGQHSDMYKRLEWDKPSVTIVNPRKAMLLHPEENRILSIRECCRLFSLPDHFVFKGRLSAMQEAIANGVPIKMGTALAKQIKSAITQFNLRNRLVTT